MFPGKLVLLFVVVGVALAGPIRNLEIPQDLGTPLVSLTFFVFFLNVQANEHFLQCIYEHIDSPCTHEDYEKGIELREEYIKEMANKYANEDVPAPACIETNDCAEGLFEAYKKEHQERFKEIVSKIKKANKLNQNLRLPIQIFSKKLV